MSKYIPSIIAIIAIASSVCAIDLKSSDVKDIAEQYVQAIENKDFNKWSSLMLKTGDLKEEAFKEMLDSAKFNSVELVDIEKTKTGYNILLKFDPKVIVKGPSNSTSYISTMSSSSYWVQMLPDGKIKYDILIPHPIPFAMSTCVGATSQLKSKDKTESGSHLQDFGIPLFGYEPNSPVKEQQKSLKKIIEWLLDEGEEWDRTDPQIPCPKELYKSSKRTLRDFT